MMISPVRICSKNSIQNKLFSFVPAAVVIGFLNPLINVTETDGAVLIQVGILSGVLQRDVVINLSTRDLEAIGGKICFSILTLAYDIILIWISDGMDYEKLTNITLTFNHVLTTANVSVTIVNNDTFERTESFMATLSFVEDPESTLSLAQGMTVAILDDDSKYIHDCKAYLCVCIPTVLAIGFNPTKYLVNEKNAAVTISVAVLNGGSDAFVPLLLLAARNGTASGKFS